MKRHLLFFILIVFVMTSYALIAVEAATCDPKFPLCNTKHDLSSEGTGSYKAISNQGGTTEICIFCHTPHSGNTEAPLWNRANSLGSYQTYTSDVLAALFSGVGYWPAEDPNTGAARVVHSKTRICLSCHDGTIALGRVVNMPTGIPSSYQQITMQNFSNIQSSSPGFIDVDLRDDHPVAIKHDSERDSLELKDGSVVSGVRLYMETGGKAVVHNANGSYIECTSCHDPHNNQFTKFLIMSNFESGLCTACHKKEIGSALPAHDRSTTPYNPDGAGKIGDTVGAVRCLNCHYSHKAGVDPLNPNLPMPSPGPYLLSFKSEGTCFNNKNRWGQNTNVCHGNGNQKPERDIQSELNKLYAHKYPDGSGKHRALEANAYGWLSSSSNWHIDCSDCHNAHTAGESKHTAGAGNTIGDSSPLYGAGGVRITWTGAWSAPQSTDFTPFESLGLTNSSSMQAPYYEYQICMKCHSSFAWGNGGSAPQSRSLFPAAMTDQAIEFNPGNASMHPVTRVTGTHSGTLVGPWAGNKGSQTMYCSDCHNTNDLNAQGPHGSSYPAILPVTYNNTYAARGIYQSSGLGASDDFCFKCHSETVYQSGGAGLAGTGFSGSGTNLHTRHRELSTIGSSNFGYRCVNCHTRVPHGFIRKAMIVVSGEGVIYGAAYEAGGSNQGKIASVISLPTGNYDNIVKNANCTTVNGCHQ